MLRVGYLSIALQSGSTSGFAAAVRAMQAMPANNIRL
jgi:hypothetical protein